MLLASQYPQLTFALGNPPAAPETIYTSSDPTVNKLTLAIGTNVAATFAAGQPVPKSQAPTATGSLLYVDLSPLRLSDAEFGALRASAPGWSAELYATGRLVCLAAPQQVQLGAGGAIDIAIEGLAMANPPAGASVQLYVTYYRVGGVTKGNLGMVSGFKSLLQAPPSGGADLHQAIALTVPRTEVLSASGKYAGFVNKLSFVLGPGPSPRAINASADTVFTLTFVYAGNDDPLGYGALATLAQAVKFGTEQGQNASAWHVDGPGDSQNPSWTLKPPAGQPLLGSGDQATVEFLVPNVVTALAAGPTVMYLGYQHVPGYADGGYAVVLEKVPHVQIVSFQSIPSPAPLVLGSAAVELEWQVKDAGALTLVPGEDVTGKTSVPKTIDDAAKFTLEADGLWLVNLDNRAFQTITAEVAPPAFSMRHYMGQIPGHRDAGLGWSQSPDILQFGDVPAPDPSQIASTFDTQPGGTTVYHGVQNFVYVRGTNTTGAPIQARIWLYYLETDTLLTPAKWRADGITVAGEAVNHALVSAGPAGVGYTNPPFELAPPAPASGKQRAFVALAENAPLSNPPVSPKPADPFNDLDALKAWVQGAPDVAFAYATDAAPSTPPTRQYVTAAAVSAGGVLVGARCVGMPTGGKLTFAFPGPDAASTIVTPAFPIQDPNQIALVPIDLGASFESSITVSYWQGATAPSSNASVAGFWMPDWFG